jgi:hypothetical protein
MSYQVLVLPACGQTDADRRIMAEYPEVFSSASGRMAMTSEEMANWQILPVESARSGKNYQVKKRRKD